MRLGRRRVLAGLGAVIGMTACRAVPTGSRLPPTAPASPNTRLSATPAAVPTVPSAATPTAPLAPSPTPLARSAAVPASTAASVTRPPIRPGIDVLLNERLDLVAGKRVGLVTNATGVTAAGESDIDALYRSPDLTLTALFGPEHGLRGDAPDGAAVASTTDPRTGLPIYSLYGATRRPTAEMVKDLDILLFDIQDVGARFYTFAYTMAYVMQAGAQFHKPVIVLDRPNPIGGLAVEGPVLEKGQESFVGLYPIPLRHGLTMGELARLFNETFGIHADLTVVPLAGWRRGMWFDQTDLPWVRPSPNILDLETATLYPGVGLIEATNVAEGRGTDKPFKNVGAPWLDGARWADLLSSRRRPGVRFQPTGFTPSQSKFQGEKCGGVLMEVTDRERFRPIETGLDLIATARQLALKAFRWQDGFRLMIGNTWVQSRLDAGATVDDLVAAWQPGLRDFLQLRNRYLLYPE